MRATVLELRATFRSLQGFQRKLYTWKPKLTGYLEGHFQFEKLRLNGVESLSSMNHFLRKFSQDEITGDFYEFKPRLQSDENRFQLSAGLNFEKLNTILSGTNHI